MKTGTANYDGGGYKKKNNFKLKDGDQVFRILPPLGDLADKGIWARYHSAVFGFKNSKGKLRPFESCEVSSFDKETKKRTVEVRDAAVDRIIDLKAKLESAKAKNDGPLVTKLNTLVGFKTGIYSVDNNWHMNVVTLDGRIGELKIRHKAKLALDAEIKKLRAEGVDPLSLNNGRFFVFTRTGSGNETNFKVSVYTEKLDVEGVGRVDRAVVSVVGPEILGRLDSEAFDLDNIFARPTPEEVAQIVSESNLLTGNSPAVDRFIDAPWKAKNAARNQTAQDDNDTPDKYEEPTPSAHGQLQKFQTPVEAATTVQTAAAAPVAAQNTAPVAPKAQTAPLAQPVKTQAQAVEEMSDEEFFAQIGAQQ